MAAKASDPLREFEHTHDQLTKLALEAAQFLRRPRAAPGERMTDDDRRQLCACLQSLRDELLLHFAVEEEGLFPFIRANLPGKADQVDRLALAHDAICGGVVRLAHAAQANPPGPALVSLYERFDAAYVLHSREEADLFATLARTLDSSQRAELAERLHGL